MRFWLQAEESMLKAASFPVNVEYVALTAITDSSFEAQEYDLQRDLRIVEDNKSCMKMIFGDLN